MVISYECAIDNIPPAAPKVRNPYVMANMAPAVVLVTHINGVLRDTKVNTPSPLATFVDIDIANYTVPTNVLGAVVEDYRLAGYKVIYQPEQQTHKQRLTLSW
ncbi:MAG: hypothetical protein Q7S87_01420 [Agitococcus sp.]|nr:hypothetical protein [Agitococcus sp.]MDO9177118.1 hypothetical protein [Agitococcus sp.]